MGLTFLTKETGLVLMGAIYAFLSLDSDAFACASPIW